MSISIATLKEAINIKETIQQLEDRLAKLFGGKSAPAHIEVESAPAKKGRGRSKMSAAARAKISAAQKARWAKSKGVTVAPKETPKKRGLSPEGRAKIVAALKARWAKQKKGVAKAAAPAKGKKRGGKLSAEGRAKIVAALKKRWAAHKKAKK